MLDNNPGSDSNSPSTVSGKGETLCRLLMENAAKYPDEVAVREKVRGIWQEVTWAEYGEEILTFAAGLDSLGVGPGDAMLIFGDNRMRLYGSMVSMAMLRAYAMPAYPGATQEELLHYMSEIQVNVALAEDQEHTDKILDLRDSGYKIEHIIYDDSRGLGDYDSPGLLSWDAVVEKGKANLKENPDLRDRLINQAGPDDPAVFLHSSGTTGKPKGIVLHQAKVIAGARNAFEGGAFSNGEEVLAYLPMAWVGDYAVTVSAGILYRFTINVPEKQETVLRDLREIAPSFYLAAPRSWDNLLTGIQVGIENTTWLKKRIYHFFMDRAITAERQKLHKEKGGSFDWLVQWLGNLLVFEPIKDQYGLSRLQNAFTGGEAIGEDTFVFYRALGIKLRQLYGQTENSAFSAIQTPDEVQLHTVGHPLPGVEVKIVESGEILIKSGSVFNGYYNNQKATDEVLQDGWLRTGDAGYLEDDGHLVVLGRVSEVVATASGEQYVPNYIENRLKFSPYIKDAAVVGAGRDQLTAMICIDIDATGHWAEINSIPYVSYTDLSQNLEVAKLLKEAFDRLNEILPEHLRLHRYVSLPKEFDPDDGEVTRTRKLRRNVVEEKYAAVITALYDGSSEVHLQVPVVYENGEMGLVERVSPIWEV